jgi:shikimate dehydrogenase
MKQRQFGLIGYPLSHSFSPGYFAAKFEALHIEDAEYKLYPIEEITQVKALLAGSIKGINVTIPYKEQVIPFLDELDPEAEGIGAVNTIKIENGKSTGYNTDVYGFEQSLLSICPDGLPGRALILGTGGAAKAVRYTLEKHGVEYMIVSRSKGDINYKELTERIIEDHLLIVNTTPLGMYPNVSESPTIPYEHIGRNHVLYDLIYNPTKTMFLQKGEINGARIKNGHDMLKLQAERAWEIWNKNN